MACPASAPWLSPEQRAEILRLYEQERLGVVAVAETTGHSRTTVARVLHEAGAMRPRCLDRSRPLDDAALPRVPHAIGLAMATLARMRLPDLPDADADDWAQVARLAALKALSSYETSRGASWKTWVILKVRLALKDAVRDMAWTTRAQRAAAEGRGHADHPVSLETLRWDDTQEEIWEPPHDRPDQMDPVEQTFRHMATDAVAAAVAALPERLRFIIQARMQERSPREIAADLGLCESRILQLQARAWARLWPRLAWIVEREAAELEVGAAEPEDRAAVRWGDERAEAEACAQLGREGLSQTQIAAALRLNPRTVKKRLASLGLRVERLRRSESSRLVPIAGFPGNREADDQ